MIVTFPRSHREMDDGVDESPRWRLPDTDYHYAMTLAEPPPYDRTFRCRATLIALVPLPEGRKDCPTLTAWGKYEGEAQENLEAAIRRWLADPASEEWWA